MSAHIGARADEIAQTVLLPGDPLRARFIAETFLDGAVCYSSVRGMLGYTGTFRGRRVSVQGTGMGMPSFSIYATELVAEYGCKSLIRVGTCGGLQDHVKVRDIVLAQGASMDSAMNRPFFGDACFAPLADFDLLARAHGHAVEKGMRTHVGGILTTDTFYSSWSRDVWLRHGILAVEMETAALYSLAPRLGCRALSILTVSDHVVTLESLSAEQRERSFGEMAEIALHLID